MRHVLGIVFGLFSTMAFANCQLDAQANELTCNKSFKAKNLEELNSYMQDFKAQDGVAKNLVVNFDYDGADLNIVSPCKVHFKKNISLKSSGTICVNAKEGIYVRPHSTLDAEALDFKSLKRIVIRNNASINAGSLKMISSGETEESRVHIRHSSNIELGILQMEANSRATLGHTSNYNVAESINLKTRGSDNLSTNEFVAIWKNTTVNTKSLNFDSHRTIKLTKGLNLTAENVSLSAPECTKNKTVLGVSDESCTSIINARLVANVKDVIAGDSVSFKTHKSTAINGIKSRSFLIDNILYPNVSDNFTYKFNNEGVYTVLFILEDNLGNKVTRSKRVKVGASPVATSTIKAHFHYFKVDGEQKIEAIFTPKIGSSVIKEAFYEYSNGDKVPVKNLYYKEKTILDLRQDIEEITLVIVDDLDQISKTTHVIDRNNLVPILNVEVYKKEGLSFVLDSLNSFDPLGEIDDSYVDFGDGNEIEIGIGDDEFTGIIEHTYANPGVYNGKISVFAYRDGKPVKYEKEFVVDTSVEPEIIKDVRFSIVRPHEAMHIGFHFDKTLLVNADVTNLVWDYGDGTTSNTREELHVHFYDAGIYEVSLTAYFSDMTSQTMKQRLVVENQGPPVVAIMDCWDEHQDTAGCWVGLLDKYSDISSAKISWGDGSEEDLPINDAAFAENEIFHTYAQDGTYEIKVDVTTFRGESGSRITEFEVRSDPNGGENQLPIADFHCGSYSAFTITCDAGGSFDPDGDITSYKLNINGNDLSFSEYFFEFNYETEGNTIVGLSVVDDQGAESEMNFVTIDVKGNTSPVAILNCSENDYKLSCSSHESSDVDYNQTLTFSWYVDNILLSNDEYFEFTGDEKKSYIVELRVNDGFEVSIDKYRFHATDNKNDLILADIDCSNEGSSRISCFIDSKGKEYDIQWSVNDILQEVTGETFIYNSNVTGKHIVKATVSNNFFQEELSKEIQLNYLEPLAHFNFSLDENGDIVLDASGSRDNGRYVWKYLWEIEGIEKAYETQFPKSTFKYNVVNNKNIKLTVFDEKDQTAEFNTFVDLSNINRPAVINFEYFQPRGKASFDVILDASKSIDPDGDIVDYKWFVESLEYSGNVVEHSFSSEGDHIVRLIVTDSDGATVIKEFKVRIEKIRILGLSSKLMPMEFAHYEFLNYQPISDPIYKFNDFEFIGTKISSKSFSILTPTKSEDGNTNLEILVDQRKIDVNLNLGEIFYPENPRELIKEDIRRVLEQNSPSTSGNSDSNYIKTYDYAYSSVHDFVENLNFGDDQDALELLAYATNVNLNQYLKKKNLLLNTYKKMMINMFFPENAYALEVPFEENMLSAEKCDEGIDKLKKLVNNYKVINLTTSSVNSVLSYVAAVQGIKGDISKAKKTAQVATVVGITAFIVDTFSKFSESSSIQSVLNSCYTDVYFPSNLNKDFSFSIMNNGKVVDEILSGQSYEVLSKTKAYTFKKYENLSSEQRKHDLFYLIREVRSFERDTLYGDVHNLVANDLLGFFSRTFDVVETGIRVATLISVDEVIKNLYDSASEVYLNYSNNIDVHKEVDLVMNRNSEGVELILDDNVDFSFDEKIMFSSVSDIDNPKMEFKFSKHGIDIESKEINLVKIVNPCKDEKLFEYPLGGGLISLFSEVSGNVTIEKGSIVCGNTSISGFITIYTGVKIGQGNVKIIGSETSILKPGIQGNISIGTNTSSDILIDFSNGRGLIKAKGDYGSIYVEDDVKIESTVIESNGKLDLKGSITIESGFVNNLDIGDLYIDNTNLFNSYMSINTNGVATLKNSDINQVNLNMSSLTEKHTKIINSTLGIKNNQNLLVLDVFLKDDNKIVNSKLEEGWITDVVLEDTELLKANVSYSSFKNVLFPFDINVREINIVGDGKKENIKGSLDLKNFHGSLQYKNLIVEEGEVVLHGGTTKSLDLVLNDVKLSNSRISFNNIGEAVYDNIYVLDNSILSDLRIESGARIVASTIDKSTIGKDLLAENASIRGLRGSSNGLKIENSQLYESSVGNNVTLSNDSYVTNNSVLEDNTFVSNSRISNAIIKGVNILNSQISDTLMSVDKNDKICDGIDDFQTEDSCVKGVD